MADVRVRAETPMLGLAWGAVVTVTRTALVDAAIAEGRLTVLDEVPEGAELRGEELDEALQKHGLPTHGLVRAKRARLTRHLHREHPVDLPAQDTTPPAPTGTPASPPSQPVEPAADTAGDPVGEG